jgi:NADH:ubiquinone oxidoreductase subunit 4 (subunit M)
MYNKEADEDINRPIDLKLSEKIIVVALIGLIVLIGMIPDLVMDLIV